MNARHAQLARNLDMWSVTTPERDIILARAVAWLERIGPVDDVCELVRAIGGARGARGLHPLELVLHLVDARPHLSPGVRRGHILEDRVHLQHEGLFADEPRVVHVPSHFIVERFALFDEQRNGVAFFPTCGDRDYLVQIAHPGRCRIVVLAVVAVQLGHLKRPTQAAVIEEIDVVVHAKRREHGFSSSK